MHFLPVTCISGMTRCLQRFMAAAACLTLLVSQAAGAESSKLNEYEIKTAYLYNFAKYVEWPTAAFPREKAFLTICIVGKGPVSEVIESLAGKTIKNRRLIIRQFSRVEDLNECHILFVNASVKTPLSQLMASLGSRPILTVSDSKGFTAAGGIIEFVPLGDKIRFEINNRAAQQVNLRISSHLLRLATDVIE